VGVIRPTAEICCRQDEVVDWWVDLLRSVAAWNINNMEAAASLYPSIDALPQIYQVGHRIRISAKFLVFKVLTVRPPWNFAPIL
jgi:hypothetical protein